jgi:hypothetical protein
LADTLYGGDENVQASAADGVELVAPVPGKAPVGDSLNIGDFDVDEETETVKTCPAGHAPETSAHNSETGETRTEMPAGTCDGCAQKERCPMKQTRNASHYEHSAKDRRLDERRRNEATDQFRERYNKRAGIEATNSGIKRRTGMSRLRIRGKNSVFHAIRMKAAGWNILQAARAKKMKAYVRGKIGKPEWYGQDGRIPRSQATCRGTLARYATCKIKYWTGNPAATQQPARCQKLCAA